MLNLFQHLFFSTEEIPKQVRNDISVRRKLVNWNG